MRQQDKKAEAPLVFTRIFLRYDLRLRYLLRLLDERSGQPSRDCYFQPRSVIPEGMPLKGLLDPPIW